MRLFLLLATIACVSISSFAQYPTDSISKSEGKLITVYAELLGWHTNVLGLGKKAKVEIEFGDESWGWKGNDGRNLLVDENGKDI